MLSWELCDPKLAAVQEDVAHNIPQRLSCIARTELYPCGAEQGPCIYMYLGGLPLRREINKAFSEVMGPG